ncbi:MAG TPA: hypothetical protein VLH19_00430 [Patescibacteria group bacterium]|nr:hypothetical protein [Patescibacteria group bacterium]
MAKKSGMGVGAILGAVVGTIAGAVGMFLSDEDNRKKVVKEAKHVEHMMEADVKKARRGVKRVVSKAKKTTKRRSR